MTPSDLPMNLALMVGVSLLVAAAMVVVPNIDNIQDWKRRKAITGTRLDGQRRAGEMAAGDGQVAVAVAVVDLDVPDSAM